MKLDIINTLLITLILSCVAGLFYVFLLMGKESAEEDMCKKLGHVCVDYKCLDVKEVELK